MAAHKTTIADWSNSFMLNIDEESHIKLATVPQIRDSAIRILRDLSYSTENSYKSVRLDVVNNSYVNLPNDYLKASFIGLLDTQTFNIIPLYLNNNITIAGDILKDSNGDALLDSKGVELLSDIARTGTSAFDYYYDQPYIYGFYSNTSIGREYGARGGTNAYGYYRINLEDDRIELEVNSNTDKVILEYVADPNLVENPYFDTSLEDAMFAGVYYYLIQWKSNVPANEKERARREWVNMRRVGRLRMQQAMMQELIQYSRRGNMNAAKY